MGGKGVAEHTIAQGDNQDRSNLSNVGSKHHNAVPAKRRFRKVAAWTKARRINNPFSLVY
jgi:hypothetical protein